MPKAESSPGEPEPIRIRMLSQRGEFDEQALKRRMPGGTLEHDDVVFYVVADEPADVVLIQNYLRYDQKVTAREGYIWKWDNEPLVARPVAPGYDRVYTHLHLPRERVVHTAPPVLDWWVGKTFDELDQLQPPAKPRTFSAIASTKTNIPGHRARHAFIERVASEFPEIDLFGHGREHTLDDKWDGIAPYQYSIAIENTSKDDYWTEKIADCFLSYTVPLYFGATNISDYFPEGSYIWLPIDDLERAIGVIREAMDNDDWSSRLEALREARRRVLEQYSFFAQISSRVAAEADTIRRAKITTRLVHGRRTKPGGWLRGKGLMGNIKARQERRRQRVLRRQQSS